MYYHYENYKVLKTPLSSFHPSTSHTSTRTTVLKVAPISPSMVSGRFDPGLTFAAWPVLVLPSKSWAPPQRRLKIGIRPQIQGVGPFNIVFIKSPRRCHARLRRRPKTHRPNPASLAKRMTSAARRRHRHRSLVLHIQDLLSFYPQNEYWRIQKVNLHLQILQGRQRQDAAKRTKYVVDIWSTQKRTGPNRARSEQMRLERGGVASENGSAEAKTAGWYRLINTKSRWCRIARPQLWFLAGLRLAFKGDIADPKKDAGPRFYILPIVENTSRLVHIVHSSPVTRARLLQNARMSASRHPLVALCCLM